jgi:hypothetical protein
MEEVGQLLTALARIALVPLVGYAVVRSARRWPGGTSVLLLALLAAGAGALGYAARDGFGVSPDTRKMEFRSETGRWCYAAGGVVTILGGPALPLVVIARARNGADRGPVGVQWVFVLYGYFMACLFVSMVLYSWLTGIVK